MSDTRVARARAEIADRREWMPLHSEAKRYLDVLSGILDRHAPMVDSRPRACKQCDYLWPCPDVLVIFNALGVDDDGV